MKRKKKIGSLRWMTRIMVLWLIAVFLVNIFIFTPSCSIIHKNTTESYLESGKKYFDKKDYKKSYKSYSKAIVLNPSLYQAYYNRATVEILIGDSLNREMAINDLGMYINANETNPQDKETLSRAYFKRAEMMLKLGYKSDACDDFKNSENLNQSNSPSASEQYRLHCK